MDNNVVIIDFDDSFTYNISALLYENGIEAKVLNWKSILDSTTDIFKNTKIIVWGPGPGHVSDYSELFPVVKKLLNNNKIFHFGVCLGHQLLGFLQGYNLLAAKIKRHGLSEKIVLNDYFKKLFNQDEIEVQFYNSLVLERKPDFEDQIQEFDDFILIRKRENLLSYQFHLESIGTSCPDVLLAPLLRILYNTNNEEVS